MPGRIPVDFLGMRFTPLPLDAAARAIESRACAGGAFAYVVAPCCAEVAAVDSAPQEFARLYSESWLTLNGCAALSAAAKLSGVALPRLDAGALAERLLTRVIDPDEAVVLIGADAGLVAAFAARFRLNNVRWRACAQSGEDDFAAIADFIAAARARYVFFCLDDAAAEARLARFVMRRGDAMGVGLCLGDALKQLCGREAPVPRWIARLRAEGMWRRLCEAAGACASFTRIAPIWRYWLLAQRGERASSSARSALWVVSSSR